jgi:SAM-dependent MidA family methyltransferase
MTFSEFAAVDNAVLKDIIAARIGAEGPISFADFIGLALYHPIYGYYQACDPTRDYQSSPNVDPIFGAMVARQLTGFWRSLDRPNRFDVFEAGAGNGRLAADILRALHSTEPELYDATSYVLQDVILDEADNASRLERAGLPLDKVGIATGLPEEPTVEGCILSNELLDALPFHRVRVRDRKLLELRVGLDGDRFVDVEAEPSQELRAYFEALGLFPGDGCEAEVCLEAGAWIRDAARALKRGYILTLDYGYEAESLYAPWRKHGTLLTFYRHTSGDDPYVRAGRQDITASVDFTTVIRAGESAGLQTLALTTQTDLLASLGVGEALSRPPAATDLEAYYALRRSVLELTDASGLGRIRALIQGQGLLDQAP